MYEPARSAGRLLTRTALALGLAVTGIASAATLNVPANFPTIQGAINAAANGDEIVVADGFYAADITINNKSITLRSASGDPTTCVVDATFTGVIISGANASPTLIGLTIRDGLRAVEINTGAKATIENCILEDCTIGGLLMNGETLTMLNTLVQNNTATNAGGGLLLASGKSTIRQSIIHNNEVNGFNAFGGGIHMGGSARLRLLDSVVTSNKAAGTTSSQGGGLYVNGGSAEPVIDVANVLFAQNDAINEGGAVYLAYRDANLANIKVDNNTAGFAAIYIENAGGTPNNVVISNALITNNVSATFAGAIRNNEDSNLTITNATIINTITNVYNGFNSIARLTNCIVGGSLLGNDIAGSGNTVVTYSNIDDGYAGEGNISVLPSFVNILGGDYRLAPDSLCIDAGNTLAPVGPAMDLDGNVRVVDNPDVDNTGLALFNGAIDMGAFEFQIVDDCPADLDGNGEIDVLDLLIILSAWGTCP